MNVSGGKRNLKHWHKKNKSTNWILHTEEVKFTRETENSTHLLLNASTKSGCTFISSMGEDGDLINKSEDWNKTSARSSVDGGSPVTSVIRTSSLYSGVQLGVIDWSRSRLGSTSSSYIGVNQHISHYSAWNQTLIENIAIANEGADLQQSYLY